MNRGDAKWVAVGIGLALVVAFLGGTLFLFQTQAMWSMDSPNACTMNATLNASLTGGVSVIPIFLVVIVGCVIAGLMATSRAYG